MRSMSSDVWGLARLARDHRLDLSSVALRVQADLFVETPSQDPTTIAAFQLLVCGLAPVVDEETATLVARKLAPLPETPEPALLALARRGAGPCRAVLELVPVLSGALCDAAQEQGFDLAPVLAARPRLGVAGVADLLVRDDPRVNLALARNGSADLGRAPLDTLIGRARHDQELARALLGREDLRALDAAPLYLHADAGQRERIRSDIEAIASLRAAGLPRRLDPQASERLMELAAARDVAAFVARLSATLNLADPAALAFEEPDRHDILALALVLAGASEEDAVRIFLTLSDAIACSVATVFRLAAIVRSTSRAGAGLLLEAILGQASVRPAARHIPVAEGEAPAREEAARRSEAAARPGAGRIRRSN